MESCISINTRQGKVIVKIAEDATQEEILVDLKKKLKDFKNYTKMIILLYLFQEKF